MDKRQWIAAIGGVSERTPRPLSGRALSFDISTEVESLRGEETWNARGRNARTLSKTEDLRVVLIALKAGVCIHEHRTHQDATVHALEGRVRIHLPSEAIDLPAGQLLTLDPDVPHDVEALDESVLLLQLGWSEARARAGSG